MTESFDRKDSPSKVGAVSEYFRQMSGVVRTSSPTHSFVMWGRITRQIPGSNAPASPLGKGSVLDWLAGQDNSFVLLLGTDFRSLSLGHYLEIRAPVPWHDVFPWEYLGVEPVGVSCSGEQKLTEVPGCSQPFKNFEDFLLQRKSITSFNYNHLTGYFIPVKLLVEQGLFFFRSRPLELLCAPGTCPACDFRRSCTKNTKNQMFVKHGNDA